MRPGALFLKELGVATYFGELNENNEAHGRSIKICDNGVIDIGYFEDGLGSTGNYITIYSDGRFRVGEVFMKDGRRWIRGTQYNTDGTENEFEKKL